MPGILGFGGKGMEAEIWMKVFELEIGVNAKYGWQEK